MLTNIGMVYGLDRQPQVAGVCISSMAGYRMQLHVEGKE